MKNYYQKSINALQLAGLSERTQQCYTRSVRQLVDFLQADSKQNHRKTAPRIFPPSTQ